MNTDSYTVVDVDTTDAQQIAIQQAQQAVDQAQAAVDAATLKARPSAAW
ncbi:hypothetical protein [Fodinicola feengrottensis]|nr:hypothetical protein [Fodinicola feengrottensis]